MTNTNIFMSAPYFLFVGDFTSEHRKGPLIHKHREYTFQMLNNDPVIRNFTTIVYMN